MTGSTASRDSRAPLGLPGTARTSVRPMTPASDRERPAMRGRSAALGAHQLGQPGHLVVQQWLDRLRRDVSRP